MGLAITVWNNWRQNDEDEFVLISYDIKVYRGYIQFVFALFGLGIVLTFSWGS